MLRRARALLSPWVPHPVRAARRRWMQERFARLSREAAFTKIYADNLWGGERGDFCSGTGSDQVLSGAYVEALRAWFSSEAIRSVVDVGCGDFRVGSQLLHPELDYTGVDIVAPLIARNRERFAGPRVRFLQLDVATTRPPAADVALIRQVLQHLSNAEIARVIEHCSHFSRLVVTEHVCIGPSVVANLDRAHGPFTRVSSNSGVFLDQPPFSLACEVLLEVPVSESEVLRTLVIRQSTGNGRA